MPKEHKSNSSDDHPVLICGMHRSGTSMITQILYYCGLHLGDYDKLTSDKIDDNPDGGWENPEIWQWGDDLLNYLGGNWARPPISLFNPNWINEIETQNHFNKMQSILEPLRSISSPWGFKDPRSTILISFWKKYYPNLKVILVVRNPIESAFSLSKRTSNHVELNSGLELWRDYYKILASSIDKTPYIVTHYGNYFKDPESEIKRLCKYLKLSPTSEQLKKAIASIKPSLYRGIASDDTINFFENNPPELVSNYEKLCDEAGYKISKSTNNDHPEYIELNQIITKLIASSTTGFDNFREQTEFLLNQLNDKNAQIELLAKQIEDDKVDKEIQNKLNKQQIEKINLQLTQSITDQREHIDELEKTQGQLDDSQLITTYEIEKLHEQKELLLNQVNDKNTQIELLVNQIDESHLITTSEISELHEQTELLLNQLNDKNTRIELLIQQIAEQNQEKGIQNKLNQSKYAPRELIDELEKTQNKLNISRHIATSFENQYNQVMSSEGWRTLNRWWTFRRKIFPNDTLRYKLFRSLLSVFRIIARKQKQIPIKPGGVSIPSSIQLDDQPSKELDLSVLYVISKDPNLADVQRYRTYNIQEQLQKRGIRVEVIYDYQANEKIEFALEFEVIVFQRTTIIPQVAELLKHLEQHNKAIVFDVDDFVFDDEIIEHVDALRDFTEQQMADYLHGVRLYREILQRADFFIGSTPILATAATKLGTPGFVIPNGINDRQLELAKKALTKSGSDDGYIRIGYLSGTNTHRKDFEEAIPALVRILKEYPNVRLSLRGQLDIPDSLKPFIDQIEIEPFLHWEELLDSIAHLDINIAPLELNNPYTEAKSTLKYFEAALVEVPTVASPTSEFQNAITSGKNGFLASNEAEWYDSLKQLVEDEGLRERTGRFARDDAESKYSSDAQSEISLSVFRKIAARNRPLDISWLVWTLEAGSGGIRSIFRMANNLNTLGHNIRVYVDDNRFRDSKHLSKFINENYVHTNIDMRLGFDAIEPGDVLMPTFWTTAEVAELNKDKFSSTCYFVQDYEPMFYPDDPIGAHKAEATYRLNFNHITIGKWLTKTLRKKFQANAEYFQFPIEHDRYYPHENKNSPKKKRILFLGRPEMPRRRYTLGIEALELIYQQHPEVEIILFGSDHIDSKLIPFPHVNKKIIRDQNALADMYRQAHVGIVFSSSNPSILPLELMACGCPVVELDNDINRTHFSPENAATLVKDTPEVIAEAVHQLLVDENLHRHKIQESIQYAGNLPGYFEACERVEEIILQCLYQDGTNN